MATVGEIASWVIKRQAQGYSRINDVIPIINEVHKLFYKHESSQGVIVDRTTGRLPVLATTQGTFVYNAPVVGGQIPWCISGVFLIKPITGDYNFTEQPPLNTSEYMQFGGNYYYPYDFVSTVDAVEGGNCTITFSRDPGNTTGRYYLLMYKEPTPITSDRIQLQIPDRDGAHLMFFFPAVMKIIESQNHGNYMEAYDFIENVLKPKMWKVLNSGAQGRRHRTKARYF